MWLGVAPLCHKQLSKWAATGIEMNGLNTGKRATVITSLIKKTLIPEGIKRSSLNRFCGRANCTFLGINWGDKKFQDKITRWLIDLPGACRVLKFVEQRRVHFQKKPKSRVQVSKQFVQAQQIEGKLHKSFKNCSNQSRPLSNPYCGRLVFTHPKKGRKLQFCFLQNLA